jgi:hypothetical protein
MIRINKYEKFCSQLSIYFKRHMGFRNVDEPFCTDDGAERDGAYITFNVLLTRSWMDAVPCNASFALLTEEEIAADVVKASAV